MFCIRNESEQNTPRRIFATRVKEARLRRGWKQKQLAARLAEIGYPEISRETIAKIENPESTRADVSISDLFAIAAALDAAPTNLLVPLGDDVPVRVTPGLPPFSAETVRDWVRGKYGIRDYAGLADVDDRTAFITQAPTSELERAMREMGMTADQVEDGIESIRTGVIPWPDGRPKVEKEERIG